MHVFNGSNLVCKWKMCRQSQPPAQLTKPLLYVHSSTHPHVNFAIVFFSFPSQHPIGNYRHPPSSSDWATIRFKLIGLHRLWYLVSTFYLRSSNVITFWHMYHPIPTKGRSNHFDIVEHKHFIYLTKEFVISAKVIARCNFE